MIECVEPLMRQRSGAIDLRQVDDDIVRLVMRRRRLRSATAAGPERNRQFAIQTQRLRRHLQHIRQIQQRIIGKVQSLLPIAAHVPVAELPATEPERLLKILRRHVALALRAAHPLQIVQPRTLRERQLVFDDLLRIGRHVSRCLLLRGKTTLHHRELSIRHPPLDHILPRAIRLRLRPDDVIA